MRVSKTILSFLAISTLLLLIICSSGMAEEKESNNDIDLHLNLSEKVLNEKAELVIYYLSPFLLTRVPLNSEMVKKSCEYKVTIDNSKLLDYNNLLQNIDNARLEKLLPAEQINERIYCEFIGDKGEICSISLAASSHGMLVNGILVKNDWNFYNLILPFIPNDTVSEYKRICNFVDNRDTK